MNDSTKKVENSEVAIIDESQSPSFPTAFPAGATDAANASLGVIIPSVKGRKIAYAIYAGTSIIVTNVAVAFSAIGANNPVWLTISLAVVGNLAAPFAAIAISNATGKK
jgi:multisubunit Na+/H+ antiporter MnhG subunit